MGADEEWSGSSQTIVYLTVYGSGPARAYEGPHLIAQKGLAASHAGFILIIIILFQTIASRAGFSRESAD